MFSVCIHYFEEFSGSGNCFKDLVFYVECLPHQEKAEFHRRIQKFIDGQVIEETKTKVGMVKWVTRMAGCSKFNYVDIMSDPVDKMQKEKLAYFIKTSLETYSTCLELLRGSEFQPGADIGILSAMTLINLSKIQHRPDSKGGPVAGASRGDVARPAAATSSSQGEGAEANDKSTKDAILEFQAAAILEHILQSSKNNYQALLMLVRLYIRLGAISLGFQVYYRFNIKNVQNDSLAHCSFTRISTLQPFPTPRDEETFVSDDNLDPALGIIRVLKSYSKDDKFAQMNSLAMKRGSYHQTLEFLNFQSQKDTSICKFMWQIERRRMSRLRGKPSGGVQEFDRMELDPITTTQSDNRDDAIFPSFEPTKDPSFEESVRVGPKPYDRWTSGFHLSEILYSEYLHNGKLRNTGFGPGDDTSIGSSLMDVLLFASGDGMNKDFTEAEKAFLSLQCSLAKLMRFLKTEESATPPGLPDLLEQVEIHLKSEIASTKRYSHPTEMDAKLGFRFLTWKFFHKVYLGLEGLQSITYFLKWSANIKQNEDKPANTLKKDGIANVNSLVHELYQAIRAAATYHKGMLMETGVMASMVDHALGRDEAGLENLVGGVIEEVLGEAHMEIISTNVIESWKVALDGILKVEID
ncbi:MAG: hypothetical protein M1829_003049 [Trizodia sp. TS-e1964]|nr:MAG: hypothetical protein M1829_003049 [Trizodia sp. TS-e1964]